MVNEFKYPKILHLYWDGSNLSFLNFLTVLSFNKYNKDWNIIVYSPTKRETNISWKTGEQNLKYNKNCYFNKLSEIENVTFKRVDLNQIGFRNDVSEVIKSDYFRYHILYEIGGLWSDFDIIYTASIEEKMNFNENTVLFKCLNKKRNSFYYPIGLLMTVPRSPIFKYLLEQCQRQNIKDYECLGATMLGNLFSNTEKIYKIDKSVKICNEDYYLPWAWNEIDEFLVKKNNRLPINNIGVHWFNGSSQSKQYSIDLDKRLTDFKTNCFLDVLIEEYIKEYNMKNKKEKGFQTYIEQNNMLNIFNNIPIFWINLADSVDRRNKMELLLQDYKYNYRVDAVDGRNREEFLKKYKVTYNCKIDYTTALIAVICSHIKAIKMGYDMGNEMICVFEDDVNFDLVPNYPYTLKNVIDRTPSNWEIIQLYYTHKKPYFITELNDFKINGLRTINRNRHYAGTCYLINKKGMEKILKHIVSTDGDKIFDIKVPLIDPEDLIFSNLNSYAINLPFLYYYNEKVTFQNYTNQKSKEQSQIIQKEAKNSLIRIHSELFKLS